MACISRITRLIRLKPLTTTLSRNLTSNPAPITPTLIIPPVFPINNPWIWRRNDEIRLPIVSKIQVDLPNGLAWVPPLEEPQQSTKLEMPTTINGTVPKLAERLIVIRRKKMKKHKLRKLRKRMKYEWAKRRQRRELKKEKAFQATLINQYKQAEAFSAEKYVEERLAKYNEVMKPKVFKTLRMLKEEMLKKK